MPFNKCVMSRRYEFHEAGNVMKPASVPAPLHEQPQNQQQQQHAAPATPTKSEKPEVAAQPPKSSSQPIVSLAGGIRIGDDGSGEVLDLASLGLDLDPHADAEIQVGQRQHQTPKTVQVSPLKQSQNVSQQQTGSAQKALFENIQSQQRQLKQQLQSQSQTPNSQLKPLSQSHSPNSQLKPQLQSQSQTPNSLFKPQLPSQSLTPNSQLKPLSQTQSPNSQFKPPSQPQSHSNTPTSPLRSPVAQQPTSPLRSPVTQQPTTSPLRSPVTQQPTSESHPVQTNKPVTEVKSGPTSPSGVIFNNTARPPQSQGAPASAHDQGTARVLDFAASNGGQAMKHADTDHGQNSSIFDDDSIPKGKVKALIQSGGENGVGIESAGDGGSNSMSLEVVAARDLPVLDGQSQNEGDAALQETYCAVSLLTAGNSMDYRRYRKLSLACTVLCTKGIYVFMYAYKHINMHSDMHEQIYTCIYVCMHINIPICTKRMHICTHECMYVNIQIIP